MEDFGRFSEGREELEEGGKRMRKEDQGGRAKGRGP
jgi:hypothetical protein